MKLKVVEYQSKHLGTGTKAISEAREDDIIEFILNKQEIENCLPYYKDFYLTPPLTIGFNYIAGGDYFDSRYHTQDVFEQFSKMRSHIIEPNSPTSYHSFRCFAGNENVGMQNFEIDIDNQRNLSLNIYWYTRINYFTTFLDLVTAMSFATNYYAILFSLNIKEIRFRLRDVYYNQEDKDISINPIQDNRCFDLLKTAFDKGHSTKYLGTVSYTLKNIVDIHQVELEDICEGLPKFWSDFLLLIRAEVIDDVSLYERCMKQIYFSSWEKYLRRQIRWAK